MKPLRIHLRHITMSGVSYENRTRDSGITTRGFTTKLTTPYFKVFVDKQTPLSNLMKEFVVKFKHYPELICRLDNTELADRYYNLVKTQYHQDPAAIFRDPQRYTFEYFKTLAAEANRVLGWDWYRDRYDLSITTRLHKDIEQYLAQGFENIPEEHDQLLHEIHFALHAIESGSRRSSWLQIEWFNDCGFEITADEYPAKINLDFGDIRLQNPYVGHHPLFLYQQQDSTNVLQTCKFHNFVKPGINLVIERSRNQFTLNQQHYLQWFKTHGAEFLAHHGEQQLLQFTGHPVVGRVVNLDALTQVVASPELYFEYLAF